MSQQKTLIFDFDGTLADTKSAFVTYYNDLAPTLNCKKISEQNFISLGDKTPDELFQKYNVTFWKLIILLLIGRYRLSKNMQNIKPHKGIIEAIKRLKKKGFNVGIITSNSVDNVQKFLKANKINGLFNFIRSKFSLFKKGHEIQKFIEEKKLNKKDVLYIGDELRDIEAAKKCDIKIAVVTWGFNSRKALSTLKPDYIIDTAEELENICKKCYNLQK